MFYYTLGLILCVICSIVFYIHEKGNAYKHLGAIILIIIGIVPILNLLIPLICIFSLMVK